jgi:CheY-like chemotaxis protein
MKKILLVDDSKSARAALRKPLEDCGFLVLEAASGEDGLNVLKSLDDALSLIITDHNMPGMTGLEMVLQLRSDPKNVNHGVPVFFLTSDSSILSKEQCLALNVKAMILKPVKPSALVEAVKKLLGLK